MTPQTIAVVGLVVVTTLGVIRVGVLAAATVAMETGAAGPAGTRLLSIGKGTTGA